MSSVLTFTCLIAFIVSLATFSQAVDYTSAKSQFTDFMHKYKKVYGTQEEFNKRFEVFQQSLSEIEAINADPSRTWTAGVNGYSDLTWEEFKARFGFDDFKAPQHCSATEVPKDMNRRNDEFPPVPKKVDWRKKGVVSPVKDQGNCGSCYTFSASAALESQWAIRHGKLYNLSPQQFVDCAEFLGNKGCNGGIPSSLFESVRIMGGQMLWDDYPYHAKQGECQFNASKVAVDSIGSFNVTAYDEHALEIALANYGPVSVTYQVVSDFKHYTSGVYSSTECKNTAQDVNHAVLASGLGFSDDGVPYFEIKNSWGTDFGMDGYFRILRGQNMCGIAACNSFPIV